MAGLPEFVRDCALLEGWTVRSLIGEGGHGKVFRISGMDRTEEALKWVDLSAGRLAQAYPGLPEAQLHEHALRLEISVLKEIEIMRRLVGYEHIVQYRSHQALRRTGGNGVDMLIRMELLRRLNPPAMSVRDVVQLGVDVCAALSACELIGIRHGDIKPENILVDRDGAFKLGDFSIAERVFEGDAGTRAKGTYRYIAPEVFHGGLGDARADLYSLGLVLFCILNDGRLPFLPYGDAPYSAKDEEDAIFRRLSDGAAVLPSPPERGGKALFEVVRRACAFSPEERFQHSNEMGQALAALLSDDSFGAQPLGAGKVARTRTPVPFDEDITSTKTPDIIGVARAKPATQPALSGISSVSGLPPIQEGWHASPEPTCPQPVPEKRNKRLPLVAKVAIGCVLGAVLAVGIWFGIRVLFFGVSGFCAEAVGASAIQVSWSDNGKGPWTIHYRQEGADAEAAVELTTGATRAELAGLVPDTQYRIVIMNDFGGNEEVTVKTGLVVSSAADAPLLIGMNVYRYLRLDLQYRTLRSMVESGKLPAVEDGNLRLRDVAPATQSEGLVLSLVCTLPEGQQGRNIELLTVLRLKDGRVFSDRKSLSVPEYQAFWGAYLDMDLLLDPLWAAEGKWPEEVAVLEAYLDDVFLGSMDIRFQKQ